MDRALSLPFVQLKSVSAVLTSAAPCGTVGLKYKKNGSSYKEQNSNEIQKIVINIIDIFLRK